MLKIGIPGLIERFPRIFHGEPPTVQSSNRFCTAAREDFA